MFVVWLISRTTSSCRCAISSFRASFRHSVRLFVIPVHLFVIPGLTRNLLEPRVIHETPDQVRGDVVTPSPFRAPLRHAGAPLRHAGAPFRHSGLDPESFKTPLEIKNSRLNLPKQPIKKTLHLVLCLPLRFAHEIITTIFFATIDIK